MQNPICISTGFLYRLTNDRNEMISKIKVFSPYGIELSFAYPQYYYNFAINKENLNYLQGLGFNSIHAPWKEITYGDNKECKDLLKGIEKLYKQINARNVVFHKEQLEDINIITSYNFTASIENGDWKESSGNSVEKIGDILKENQKLKFTFDFAHAITVSSDDVSLYVSKFKNKLIEIHLAMLNKDLKDHWFLHKYNTQEIRNLLDCLKNTDIPIVLECVASNDNEVNLIIKEMDYIKNF